jgi:putative ABC transport system permease protein
VSRRAREIGIRMALGARSQQVVFTVAREVALLVGVGTGAGLTLSLLAILGLRLVTVSTPGVSLYRPAADPIALLSIAAFMALVGLAAAYVFRPSFHPSVLPFCNPAILQSCNC